MLRMWTSIQTGTKFFASWTCHVLSQLWAQVLLDTFAFILSTQTLETVAFILPTTTLDTVAFTRTTPTLDTIAFKLPTQMKKKFAYTIIHKSSSH